MSPLPSSRPVPGVQRPSRAGPPSEGVVEEGCEEGGGGGGWWWPRRSVSHVFLDRVVSATGVGQPERGGRVFSSSFFSFSLLASLLTMCAAPHNCSRWGGGAEVARVGMSKPRPPRASWSGLCRGDGGGRDLKTKTRAVRSTKRQGGREGAAPTGTPCLLAPRLPSRHVAEWSLSAPTPPTLRQTATHQAARSSPSKPCIFCLSPHATSFKRLLTTPLRAQR